MFRYSVPDLDPPPAGVNRWFLAGGELAGNGVTTNRFRTTSRTYLARWLDKIWLVSCSTPAMMARWCTARRHDGGLAAPVQ